MLYNKLVRDRIPDIIRAEGRTCEVFVLDDHAYRQALRTKLVEEAEEAAAAQGTHIVTELADVLEVVEALLAASGIPEAMVRQEQERRRADRGGFTEKLCLVRAE